MDIAFPSRYDGARVRTQEHPSAEQIPIDFVDTGYIKRLNLAVMHFHGQVRPHSLNWVTRQKDHLQVWEISNNLPNDFLTQRRIIWRNITRKERCLGFKQSPVILEVDARFSAETLQPLKKSKIAFISAARTSCALNPAQLIKVMQFLYRRHPEIRMRIELLKKPSASGFVGSDT
jgi:hypothetical protein